MASKASLKPSRSVLSTSSRLWTFLTSAPPPPLLRPRHVRFPTAPRGAIVARSLWTMHRLLSAPPRMPKQPLKPGTAAVTKKKQLPLLESSQEAALKRRNDPRRTGVIAYKKGSTAIFNRISGRRTEATVLQLDRVQVVSTKTVEEHGYWAVQVGCGLRDWRNVTKPLLGHYSANRVSPKEHLVEFRVRNRKGLLPPGTVIPAHWYKKGQLVDLRSNCKGKGFAGGMKRHGFGGQPATHGTSLTHRAMGSAGQSQGGGSRVLPGKRMAGRMGGQQVTRPKAEILRVDPELNIIVVKGSVAGPKGCVVKIQDAYGKPASRPARLQDILPASSPLLTASETTQIDPVVLDTQPQPPTASQSSP